MFGETVHGPRGQKTEEQTTYILAVLLGAWAQKSPKTALAIYVTNRKKHRDPILKTAPGQAFYGRGLDQCGWLPGSGQGEPPHGWRGG